ncbi:MAG: heme exporter protein CcmB [Legionellaceae bacterium]|nr:heme exporter protein CcmB [Legionellaceae bacterium]
MPSLFLKQCQRELFSHYRHLSSTFYPLLLFVLVLIFFPLTLPIPLSLLHTLAPGIFWMALLFCFLLGAESIFYHTREDGILEQWVASRFPMTLFIAPKLLMHWLFLLVGLIPASLIGASLFSLSWPETKILLLSILVGTPCMFLLSALASAFHQGRSPKGGILAFIIAPFTIPVLIFGSACLQASMQHFPVSGYIALLSAFSLLSLISLPTAIGFVLKTYACD